MEAMPTKHGPQLGLVCVCVHVCVCACVCVCVQYIPFTCIVMQCLLPSYDEYIVYGISHYAMKVYFSDELFSWECFPNSPQLNG